MSKEAWPPKGRPMPPPKQPAIEAWKLPQHVPPSRASRALQIGAFVFSAGLGAYAVLLYDWGDREHCFMPIRRWVDDKTQGLFTLTDQERQTMGLQPAIKPETKTPIEYFKEERQKSAKP